ncbi:hypothetical protein [Pandoraea apista]|uniref:hypothetical protein n=1 Tax=Pandoraea apista TaxID=93218 RepID=UPI000658C2D5|nr:hypothetical protein [Pandoraea apista]ALS64905.1 hypothetical protein AT395_07840 [Pandoraea apista]CFB65263.1 hypothetical protein LMG16407_04771 [Pandoraea apista]
MALYFLSYDLRNARNYQPLYDELAKFNAVQVLESVWTFARYNTTSEALRNHFKGFIDSDDGLLIIKASSWAGTKINGTPPTPTSWD